MSNQPLAMTARFSQALLQTGRHTTEFIGAAFAAAVGATTKTLHAHQAARAPSADHPQVRTWQPQVERLFKSPDIHPNALEATPDGLWIGDQVSEKVLKVDWKTGEVLFELQTESHNMSGLAVGAGYFWIGSNGGVSGLRPPRPTDRPFGEISQIEMKTGKVVKTFRAPGHGGVHGTTYVPQTQTLWVTALNIQAVVEMDVKDNLRILRMFPARGDRAHGLDWDDGAMWVLFAGDREIRKCDPNGGKVLRYLNSPVRSIRTRTACASTTATCTTATPALLRQALAASQA